MWIIFYGGGVFFTGIYFGCDSIVETLMSGRFIGKGSLFFCRTPVEYWTTEHLTIILTSLVLAVFIFKFVWDKIDTYVMGLLGGVFLTLIVYFLNYWLEIVENETALWICIPLFFLTVAGGVMQQKEEKAKADRKEQDIMRNPVIGGALGALTIYLYLEDQHKEFDISLISAIAVFVIIFGIVTTINERPKKFCAWCGKKSGLSIEKDYFGEFSWEYKNKDGSPDMRRKNNKEEATYYTLMRCENCNALTKRNHGQYERGKTPKNPRWVSSVTLVENGDGERMAKDWYRRS